MTSLEARFSDHWPAEAHAGVPLMVAVSGGADSVALLRLLAATNSGRTGKLIVGHFNHRLRGDESDRDEEFVRDLSCRFDLPIEVGRAGGQTGELTEAEARGERYRFLSDAAGRRGARYLATAHTADDQVETIIHRIARGTGLAGLAGIPRVRRLNDACTLVRPLLFATRAEILDYLQSLGQEFQIDATNEQLHFTRNRIRHEVLPRLAEINPHFRRAVLGLGKLAGEAQDLVSGLADELRERAVLSAADGFCELSLEALQSAPRYVVRELLVKCWRERGWPEQAMGFDEWQALAEFALGETALTARDFPGGVRVARVGGELRLSRPRRDDD